MHQTRNKRYYSSRSSDKQNDPEDDDNYDPKTKKENMKRLFKILWKERVAFFISLATLALSAGATLTLPAALGKGIDILGTPEAKNYNLDYYAAGLAGLLALSSAASFVRVAILNIASTRIVMSLRKQLFEALITKPSRFFDVNTSGELVSRLSADTEIMSSNLIENSAHAVRRIIEGAGGLGILLYLSPQLTLVMLSVIPPVFVGAVYYGKINAKLSQKFVLNIEKKNWF